MLATFLYDTITSIVSALAFAAIAYFCKYPEPYRRLKRLIIPLAVGGIAGSILPLVGFFVSWKMVNLLVEDPDKTALANYALGRMSVENLFVALVWLFILWLYREMESEG